MTFSLSLLCALATVFLFLAGGCSKAKEPAKIILNIDGQEFSDAQIYIDGKSVGCFTQTVIKPNGELYIDGVLQATLPPRGTQPEEDTCSGALDSLILPPGNYTITYLSSAGKRLEFAVDIVSGYHLVTYFPEKETIKWDDESFKISPGQPQAIKLKGGRSK
ncbi:MAG: hypothetical protein C0399_01120 [Syntrophus sp. (in: bacteria)]|nr:hypothetical protein [Syntrophus sp. (in: bacteria)]